MGAMAEPGPGADPAEIWEDLRDRLTSIGRFDDLEVVWLYGSAARGDATDRSDVDVACSYDVSRDKLSELSVRLAGRLPDRYDAEVFQLLPLQIRREVVGGEVLWARETDRVYDIAIETLRDWSYFEPLYRTVIS